MLPDILSLPIQGETIQKCLDAYFASEEITKRCSNCMSLKSYKSSQLLVHPSTLILQLKRFSYHEAEGCVKKHHVPVKCPLNLSFDGSQMYQLNSVINHIGESSNSGHYNVLFHAKLDNSFVLVDDSDICYNAKMPKLEEETYVVIYDIL